MGLQEQLAANELAGRAQRQEGARNAREGAKISADVNAINESRALRLDFGLRELERKLQFEDDKRVQTYARKRLREGLTPPNESTQTAPQAQIESEAESSPKTAVNKPDGLVQAKYRGQPNNQPAPRAMPATTVAYADVVDGHMREGLKHWEDAAGRTKAKHPENADICDGCIEIYKRNAAKFSEDIHRPGTTSDPRAIMALAKRMEYETQREINATYPTVVPANASVAERAMATRNTQGLKRFDTAVRGEGMIESAFKTAVYDEDKGSMQWAGLGGLIGGGLLGGLMGTFIAGSAGGGWLGMIATVMLAVSGAAAGSKFANYLATAATPATPPPAAESTSPNQGKAIQKDGAPSTDIAKNEAVKKAVEDTPKAETPVLGGKNVKQTPENAAYTPPKPATPESKKTPASGK